MSNIVAGIEEANLPYLIKEFRRKERFLSSTKELSHLEGVQMMPEMSGMNLTSWLSCILLTGKVRPLGIIEALEKENIEARPIWKPLHTQPFYKAL